MADPTVIRYISSFARKYGLDPRAVLAVAQSEGGLSFGALGDKNKRGRPTSFGPFQLHEGGALPSGRGASWANSPQGLEFAIRQMAQSGAKGLSGQQAISKIVSGFERPADPQSEIARAMGYYGNVKPIFGDGTNTPEEAALVHSDPMRNFGSQLNHIADGLADQLAVIMRPIQVSPLSEVLHGTDDSVTQRVISGLHAISQSPVVHSLQDLLPPQVYDTAHKLVKDVFEGFHQDQDIPKAGSPQLVQGSLKNYVTLAAGANRSGMGITLNTLQFVASVAQVYGKKLTIGTGSNHNRYVKGTNRQSDHWTGDAADIPMSGKALTRLGRDALIAAGADPKWARRQKGGVFNINGYNILFNTSVGGNHYNHLHVGLGHRPGSNRSGG